MLTHIKRTGTKGSHTAALATCSTMAGRCGRSDAQRSGLVFFIFLLQPRKAYPMKKFTLSMTLTAAALLLAACGK
ncbi:MAG: hypothetical protein LWW82_11915, partial [Comamonadaceae bacterium]|nr:hypothetical protein [Comamonadaceae bacterium]